MEKFDWSPTPQQRVVGKNYDDDDIIYNIK